MGKGEKLPVNALMDLNKETPRSSDKGPEILSSAKTVNCFRKTPRTPGVSQGDRFRGCLTYWFNWITVNYFTQLQIKNRPGNYNSFTQTLISE